MMPPKKSKAAREKGEHVENGTDTDAPEPKEGSKEPKAKAAAEKEPTDIFATQIVDGKRKREAPPAEKFLHTWFADNFERRDEADQKTISKTVLYDKYCDACVEKEAKVVDPTLFNRVMKTMFPKGIGVKERSMYAGEIKEKSKEKSNKESKNAAKKSDGPSYKWCDVISDAIKELKNPMAGVQFTKLKVAAVGLHPEINVGEKDARLLFHLEREVYAGRVLLMRGIHRCGFYRLPGDSLDEEEMRKIKLKEEKAARAREAKKEEKEKKELEKKKEQGEGSDEKAGTESDKGDDSGKENKVKAPAKVKQKRKKSKSSPMPSRKRGDPDFVVHSAPKRVRDTFPLAMTFMTEPKEATVKRIINYVDKHYSLHNVQDKVQKCITSGIEEGYFDLIAGNTSSGRIQLTVDKFDPSYDDNVLGMVINAVVALTEPKQCATRSIETYILDYHEEFRIADRKYLLKRAIEKAEAEGTIQRVSGIGMGGSVKLTGSFHPSPRILQGEDTEDDYRKGDDPADLTSYEDEYRPRPTKRGHGRIAAAGINHYVAVNYPRNSASTTSHSSKPAERSRSKKNPDEFEDFLDDYKPRPSKSRSRNVGWVDLDDVPKKKKVKATTAAKPAPSKPKTKAAQKAAPSKVTKRDRKPSAESEDEDEDEPPRKKKSPEKTSRKSKAQESESEEEDEVQVKTSKRGAGKEGRTPRKSKAQESESEEDDEVQVKTPKRGAGKEGRNRKVTKDKDSESEESEDESKKSRRKSSKSPQYKDDGSEMESDEEPEPPKKSPVKKAPVKKAKGRLSRAAKQDSDSEGSEVADTKKKASTKRESSKRARHTESDSGDESEEESPKKKSPRKQAESRSKPKYKEESESDVESEEEKSRSGSSRDRRSIKPKYKDSDSEASEDEKPKKKSSGSRDRRRSKYQESDSGEESGSEEDRSKSKKSTSRRRPHKK